SVGYQPLITIQHAGDEPATDHPSEYWERVQLVEQGGVCDAVKARRDICVQHVLWLVAYRVEDGFDRVMGGASWSEPITVWLESSLPFGFQGKPHQRLAGAVRQGRNAKRSLFHFARLGNPDPANGACLQMWRQVPGQVQSLVGSEVLDPIYASGLLAPIVLRHLADS